MKVLVFIILSITLISCGKKKNDNNKSVTLSENLVSNCTVERDEELSQVKISCPDGSEEIISDGKDGQDGQDGTSCSVEDMIGGAMISCGETQAFIKDGANGADGSACSVAQDSSGSGALISCSDGSSAFIKNGDDGQNGENGKDGLDFVAEVIDPCGQQTTHGLDEVLLRLHSGDILAHFAQGDKQYLTILVKNKSYITTDGTGCKFTIDKEGKVID